MKSSTNQLLECLQIIIDTKETESNLTKPSMVALHIGEKLENIDSNLYNKWMKTKEFYQKNEEEIEDTLKNLYKAIQSYSEDNLALEESSVKAVLEANNVANEILKELEL